MYILCKDEAPINLFPSLFFLPLPFVCLSNAHLPDKIRQKKTRFSQTTPITFKRSLLF